MWGTKSCLPADTAPDVIIISILDLKLFSIFTPCSLYSQKK